MRMILFLDTVLTKFANLGNILTPPGMSNYPQMFYKWNERNTTMTKAIYYLYSVCTEVNLASHSIPECCLFSVSARESD